MEDTQTALARVELFEAIERGARVDDVCRLYAIFIYHRVGMNKVKASIALDINRRTLQRWLKAQEEILLDTQIGFILCDPTADDE
jgi:hypothetical protein